MALWFLPWTQRSKFVQPVGCNVVIPFLKLGKIIVNWVTAQFVFHNWAYHRPERLPSCVANNYVILGNHFIFFTNYFLRKIFLKHIFSFKLIFFIILLITFTFGVVVEYRDCVLSLKLWKLHETLQINILYLAVLLLTLLYNYFIINKWLWCEMFGGGQWRTSNYLLSSPIEPFVLKV